MECEWRGGRRVGQWGVNGGVDGWVDGRVDRWVDRWRGGLNA